MQQINQGQSQKLIVLNVSLEPIRQEEIKFHVMTRHVLLDLTLWTHFSAASKTIATELLTISRVQVRVWQSVLTHAHPQDTCYPVPSSMASASAETRSTPQYTDHPMHAPVKKVHPTSVLLRTVFFQQKLMMDVAFAQQVTNLREEMQLNVYHSIVLIIIQLLQ